jgi:hypothetical protein
LDGKLSRGDGRQAETDAHLLIRRDVSLDGRQITTQRTFDLGPSLAGVNVGAV